MSAITRSLYVVPFPVIHASLEMYRTSSNIVGLLAVVSLHPRRVYGTFTAYDTLQNSEAAGRALISALGVPPPVEAGEVAELTALSSKVLSSLSDKVRGRQGKS